MAEDGDDGFDWYSYYLNFTNGTGDYFNTGAPDYNDTYDYMYDPYTVGELEEP